MHTTDTTHSAYGTAALLFDLAASRGDEALYWAGKAYCGHADWDQATATKADEARRRCAIRLGLGRPEAVSVPRVVTQVMGAARRARSADEVAEARRLLAKAIRHHYVTADGTCVRDAEAALAKAEANLAAEREAAARRAVEAVESEATRRWLDSMTIDEMAHAAW